MTNEKAKKIAAARAAELIHQDMIIGLGSGTTAQYFIEFLGKRILEGLKIHAVATSVKSENLAEQAGIPLLNIQHIDRLDLTIDGADEVDTQKQMIKGAGGALLREKILANMSKEMIVIVDETKQVHQLGKHPLALEIVPFGCLATKRNLERKGYQGKWRLQKDGSFFITDNGNYILDIYFDRLRDHPEKDHLAIKEVPGVIETGFFFRLAGRVVIGFLNGNVVIQ